MTLTADTIANSSDVAPVTSVGSPAAVQAGPVALPADVITTGRTVRLMIEKAQAYYWTTKWQDGLERTIADLQAGQYVRFDSDDPTDVARWLLDGNDD